MDDEPQDHPQVEIQELFIEPESKLKTQSHTVSEDLCLSESGDGTTDSRFDLSDELKELSEIPSSLDNALLKSTRKRDVKRIKKDSDTVFQPAKKPVAKKTKAKADPSNPKTRGRNQMEYNKFKAESGRKIEELE